MDINDDMLPAGLGFSMAMNQDAMKRFSNMSPEEKADVISESRSVKSKEEMQRIIDRLASDTSIG